jgi:hemolysin activation/secretion protein
VLHRGRDSKTRLAAFLNYKDSENFIEDVKLEGGHRRLNVVGVRLSHMHRIWDGRVDTSVSGHFGVPMFGSLTDERPSSFKAEFTKVSGDIGFYRPFAIETQNFAWNVRGSGQWTQDQLYSTEQISLGSMYTVRGFKNQSLSADTGGYVRNELIWAVPQMLPDGAKPVLGNLAVFAGYDHGWVKTDKTEGFEQGQVSGLASGVRLTGGWLTAEAAYEKPLEAPQFIRKEEQLRLQAGVSVKW